MLIALLVLSLCLMITLRPKKAVKPLVWTARVKRLMATCCVVLLIVTGSFLVVWWFRNRDVEIWFFIMYSIVVCAPLAPLIVYLAAFINAPIERAIANRYIADAKRMLDDMPQLVTIGVTGSFGKSSVKHYAAALLSEKYDVLMTPESYNTTLGVVRTIREQLRPTHQVFVCEMGARQRGDIKEICDLVHPKFGMITALGEQHLETFKTVDNIIATKYELADALPSDGVLFVNADNELIARNAPYGGVGASEPTGETAAPVCDTQHAGSRRECGAAACDAGAAGGAKTRVIAAVPHVAHNAARGGSAAAAARPRVVSYGEAGRDYVTTNISVSVHGTAFDFTTPSCETHHFETPLIGAHNVQNVAGALAVAFELGIDAASLQRRTRRLECVPHRLQLLDHGAFSVIDDAYNSNPAGAKAALDTLALFDGAKLLITPGMVELGEREADLNRVFGAQAAAVCDYIVLVGESRTRPIRDGALSAGFDAARLYTAATFADAYKLALSLETAERKTILIENDLPDSLQ